MGGGGGGDALIQLFNVKLFTTSFFKTFIKDTKVKYSLTSLKKTIKSMLQ